MRVRKVFVAVVMAMVLVFCGYAASITAEPKPKSGVATDSGEPALTP